MTELYALTSNAKENLLSQIETKTSEIRKNYPLKEEFNNFRIDETVSLKITQEDIDDLLSNDSYYTETTVFKNDTVAIVLGPQYETLTLPDTIKYVFFGDQQHTIKSEQFLNKTNLRRVFGKNISTIQAKAFCGSGLESFYVSLDSSTMFVLEDQAFKKCQNLYSVDLDVSLTYIPFQCFYGCSSLRTFKIYHPESLRKLYTECFTNCRELQYILGLDDVELNAIDSGCFDRSGLVYLGINGPTIQWNKGSSEDLVCQNNELVDLRINVHTLDPSSVTNAPKLQYFRLGPNSRALHEHVLSEYVSPDLIWIDCNYPDLDDDTDWFNPDWTYFETVRMITYRNKDCTFIPTFSIRSNDNLTFFEVPEHIRYIDHGSILSNNTLETLLLHDGLHLKDGNNPFGVIKKIILIMVHDENNTDLYDHLSAIYGEDKVKLVYMR